MVRLTAPMAWSGIGAGELIDFGVIAAFAASRYDGKVSIGTLLAAAGQPRTRVRMQPFTRAVAGGLGQM